MNTSETTSSSKSLVTVTDDALTELRRIAASEEGQGKEGVRLGVKGGGCSGFSYVLEFDGPREGDHVLDYEGVKFFIDRKSAIYLKGIQLDYKSGLRGKGFAFQNPNATSTCGCGESFSV
jgi:iron-sulfur cluster assembly protein